MINVSIVNQFELIAFWLFFTRCVSILFQMPLFEDGKTPVLVRVLGMLVITYSLYPMVSNSLIAEVEYFGVDKFWLLTIGHAFIGLTIGLLAKNIMGIFTSVGNLISQQMGFASVSYFDPSFNTRGGPFELLISWVLTIMILKTGALLPILKGLTESVMAISMLNISRLYQTPEFYIKFFNGLLVISFLLSAPILFTNLFLNLILGIVARLIPQMNVLMVSFVVNIGIGLFVFVGVSDEMFQSAYRLYIEKLSEWFLFVTKG